MFGVYWFHIKPFNAILSNWKIELSECELIFKCIFEIRLQVNKRIIDICAIYVFAVLNHIICEFLIQLW